ncbi:putative protein kinase-like domain superfamily [Helianthus anomalus]
MHSTPIQLSLPYTGLLEGGCHYFWGMYKYPHPYFLYSLKEGRLFQVLDEHLQLNDVQSEIIQVSRLAERCLRVKADERPTMKEVAIVLQGILASMVEEHPWVQSCLNEGDGEYLLKELTKDYECTNGGYVSNVSSSTFDSMSKHTMLTIASGR